MKLKNCIFVLIFAASACTVTERGMQHEWGCYSETRTFLPLVTVWGECQPWFWSFGISDTSFSVKYAGEQAILAAGDEEDYIEDTVCTQDEIPLYWIWGKRYFISRGRYVNRRYNKLVNGFRGQDVQKRRTKVHDEAD